MRMNIDKARCYDKPRRIDDALSFDGIVGYPRNLTFTNAYIGNAISERLRIHDPTANNDRIVQLRGVGFGVCERGKKQPAKYNGRYRSIE